MRMLQKPGQPFTFKCGHKTTFPNRGQNNAEAYWTNSCWSCSMCRKLRRSGLGPQGMRGRILHLLKCANYNALKGGYKAPNVTIEQVLAAIDQNGGYCPVRGIQLLFPGDKGYRKNAAGAAKIEHCHVMGQFRGVVSCPVNTLFGQFDDDPVALRAAGYDREADHLEQYQF